MASIAPVLHFQSNCSIQYDKSSSPWLTQKVLRKTVSLLNTNGETLMRHYNAEVKSSLTLMRNSLIILVNPVLHTLRFLSEPLPSKTSSDFVNKVSNTHRQITRPTQDVTVKMKACISLESFDSVSTKSPH